VSEQDSQEVCDSSIEASNTGTARTPGPPAASSLTAPRTVSSEAAAATTLYRKQRQPIQYPRGELPTDDRNSRYPQRARGLLGFSPRHYLGVHSTSTTSRSQRQHSWTLQQHSPIWGPTLHRISTSTTSPREGIQPATAPLGSNPAIAPAKIRPKQPTDQHRQHSTTQLFLDTPHCTALLFLDDPPTISLSTAQHRTALPRRPTPHRSSSTAHTPVSFSTAQHSLPGPHRLPDTRACRYTPDFPSSHSPKPQPTDSVRTPSSHQPPEPQPSRPLP